MNRDFLKKALGLFLAVAAGGTAGFFIVLSAVFSDYGGQVSERLFSLLTVAITFSLLGFVFGYYGRETSWWWGIYLSLPAVSFLLVYMFKETGVILISLVYMADIVVFASGASYLGSKVERRPKKKP